MKLTIKKNILMEHLNYVIKGISNKNIIPILNCIKFDLTKDGLYLMSTDNEIAIKSFIDKKDIEDIAETGSIVVAGRYMYEIVRKLDNENINIEELLDSQLNIYTSKSTFTLNLNLVNDYPPLDLEEQSNPIVLNKRILKAIINQTIFATANNESQPLLTGINFKIHGDTLEAIATDSYRVAKKVVKLNKSINNDINVIIPTRNLNELLKLLQEDEEDIELHIFNNKVIFKFNSIVMMSRIINGNYPDASKIIPTDFEVVVKGNLNEIYNAIDRASLLSIESEKNTIKLQSNGNEMIVSSTIPEIGYVEEKVQIKKNNSSDIKIAFNAKYILDALRSFDSEEVELKFNGDVKPFIIKNPENDNLIQLILPIKVY